METTHSPSTQGLPSNLIDTGRPDQDDDFNDTDSALGSETYTLTTSLSPSVKNYREENGRRYHAFDSDAYFLPNDEIEAARLDLQHYTWKLTFDGNFGRVPLTSGDRLRRILDVGTGTGIWAMEVADAFPEKEVVGTDLSPIQPDFVPPNCEFVVDDVEREWAWERKFDYVHCRMLCLGMHDWPRFFAQCWENLNPGGWLETCEVQFPPRRADQDLGNGSGGESKFLQWGEYVYESAAKAGIDARASEKFSQQLEAQGFVNVSRVDIQWPLRPWPKGKKNKVMGKLLYENTQQAIPAIAMALFTRQLGWTKEDVDKFCEECQKDVDDVGNHFYYPM